MKVRTLLKLLTEQIAKCGSALDDRVVISIETSDGIKTADIASITCEDGIVQIEGDCE